MELRGRGLQGAGLTVDPYVKTYLGMDDDDLILCHGGGVAYQRDMHAGRVLYDAAYLAKCAAYNGSAIAQRVNAGRIAMLCRHLIPGVRVLDIGAGTGEFIAAASAAGFAAYGYDVIPDVADMLRAARRYDDIPAHYDAVTMWDAIEHMEEPGAWLTRLSVGAALFVSIPEFPDLNSIRSSKHYRPGEHLYYWTAAGFVGWMALYGYRLIERSTHEIDAGRESIAAFAFRRVTE